LQGRPRNLRHLGDFDCRVELLTHSPQRITAIDICQLLF
jgi:hypothetical protein